MVIEVFWSPKKAWGNSMKWQYKQGEGKKNKKK
jgi:hypothetical protein